LWRIPASTTLTFTDTSATSVAVDQLIDNVSVMSRPAMTPITEDDRSSAGQTVADILASAGIDLITDADAGAVEGIAITAVSGGYYNSTFQYSVDGGSVWRSTWWQTNSEALLLRATDLIRFMPGSDLAEGASFTFRAWDQTSGAAGQVVNTGVGGGGTAFSSGTATVTMATTGINDAPRFGAPQPGVSAYTPATGTSINGARDLVVLADGSVITVQTATSSGASNLALVKYRPDGSVDTGFGSGGLTVSPFAAVNDSGFAVAVQADGRILVAGQVHNGTNDDAVILRYLADGTLDTGFGSGGTVTYDSGGADDIQDLVVQGDGRIVAVGKAGSDTLVLRLNTDGSLDTGFSGDGVFTIDTGGTDLAAAVALQADGRIVVAGTTGSAAYVLRLNTNGTIDTGFNGTGIATSSFGAASAYAVGDVLVQADGGIIVAGAHGTGHWGLTRFNTGGTLDTSFNGTGHLVESFGGNWGNVAGVEQLSDGTLVVGGYMDLGKGQSDWVLARYNLDGSRFTTFGTDGVATPTLGPNWNAAYAMGLGAGDTLVMGGYTSLDYSTAVVRFDAATGAIDPSAQSGLLDAAPSFTEGGPAVVLDADVFVYDPELWQSNYAGATLTLVRNGGASTDDLFSASGTLGALTEGGPLVVGGITVGTVTLNSGGTLVLTFNTAASGARVNDVARQIAYANASDAPPASVQIDWVFDDGNTGAQGSGGALQAVGSTTVTITAVNDAPALVQAAGGGTYFENAAGVYVDITTTVSDADSADFDGGQLTVTISANGEVDDRLTVRAGFGVTVSGTDVFHDAGSGAVLVGTVAGGAGHLSPLIVTFNANATAASVQAVARQVSFSSVSDNPSGLQRSITTQVSDGDGGSSSTRLRVMNVIPVNDAPVLGFFNGSVVYTEGLGAVVLDVGASISDADSADFDGGALQVAISANGQAEDRLAIRNQGTGAGQIGVSGANVSYGGTLIGTFSGGTDGSTPLVVSFNANATLAAVQALARNITYENVSDAPSTAVRTIQATVTDGDGGTSNTSSGTLSIVPVNDAPVNVVPGTQLVSAGVSLVFSSAGGNAILVSDADVGGSAVQVTLSATHGRLTLSGTGGLGFSTGDGTADSSMTFTGTLAALNAALDGLIYTPDAGYTGSASLQIDSNDLGATGSGGALNDSDLVSIQVTESGLWLSTDKAATAAASAGGLSWTDGAVMRFGNPYLVLGSGTTTGTFSQVFDVDSFAADGNANITALHFVRSNVTVGTVNPVSLQPGDVLFAVDTGETFGGQAVGKSDVVLFRPVVEGNYSAGSFSILLRNPGGTGNDVRSIALVEAALTIGGTSLQPGDFLLSLSSASYDKDVSLFRPTTMGTSPTGGTLTELIDGQSAGIGFGQQIFGLDIVSRPVVVGGQSLAAGQLLVSLNNNDLVGTNNLSVSQFDIFTLNVTATGTGTSSGTASLVFRGADVGLTAGGEMIEALSLTRQSSQAPVLTLPSGSAIYLENAAPVLIDAAALLSDPDSNQFNGGVLRVELTGNATVDDRLAIRDEGSGIGQIGVLGSSVTYGGLQIASFTGGTDGLSPLTIQLGANSTLASTQALLRNLTYANVSDSPSTLTRTVTLELTDGSGGTSAPVQKSVTVIAVNDAPSGSDATVSTAEDSPRVLSLADFGFVDVDGHALMRVHFDSLPGTGTLRYNGIALGVGDNVTRGDILAGLLTYTPVADASGSAQASFAFRVQDDGGTANGGVDLDATPNTITIDIAPVNDAPVNTLPGLQVTPLNTVLVIGSAQGNALQVSDIDAGAGAVQLSLSVAHGTLSLATTAGLSFSTGDGTADVSLVFSGTLAAVNAALDGLSYTPTTAYEGSDTLNVVTSDLGNTGSGGTLTDSDSVQIQVGARRYQEGLNGYTGTQDTYLRDNAATTAYGNEQTVVVDYSSPLSPGLIRFDNLFGAGANQIPAGSTITSATLSVYVLNRDNADIVTLHRMLAPWSEASTHNSLTSGVQYDNVEAVSAALATIDAGLEGWVNITGLGSTVQAWASGEANHGWVFQSDQADAWTFASSEYTTASLRPYLSISYTPPQAPVVATSGGSAAYVENGAAVAIDPGLTLSDADSTQLTGATIAITGGFVAGQDLLGYTTQSGITGSYDTGTGVLTLSGTATVAQYEAALRSVTYVNSSDAPSTTPRTVAFSAQDAWVASSTATRGVTVTAVNDAPVLTLPISLGVTEDTATVLTGISISDVDAAGGSVELNIVVDGADLDALTGAGVDVVKAFGGSVRALSLTGTVDDINAFLAAGEVTFTPGSNATGSVNLNVSVNDLGQTGSGGNQTDGGTIAMIITAVNDAPTGTNATLVTAEDGPRTLSAADFGFSDIEDHAFTQVRISTLPGVGVLRLNGVDVVAGDFVTAAQLGAGELVWTPPADANGAALASFTFQVQDDGGTANGGVALDPTPNTITLDVSAVNDAPVHTMPGVQVTPVNTPLVLSTAQGRAIQISDVDAGAGSVQVSLSVAHGSLSLATTAGLSFSTGDGTADASLVFSGTLAAINAALDGLSYTPTTAFEGDDTLTVVTSDLGNTGTGGVLSDSDALSIHVGAVSFQQGVDGYTGTEDTFVRQYEAFSAFGNDTTVELNSWGGFAEHGLIRFDNVFGSALGQIPLGATITGATLSVYVSHPNDTNGGATVSIYRMLQGWSEASTWSAMSNGIQTNGIEAAATASNTQSATQGGWVAFTNLAADLQAWAGGGSNFGWALITDDIDAWNFLSSETGSASLRPYLSVSYQPPQAAVVTTSGGSASYTENGAPVAIDPGLTLSDADSTQLTGATVAITGGFVAGQDLLGYTTQSGITGSYDTGTGVLTLSGTATVAQYQTALRSVTYANNSDAPGTSPRTIAFEARDTWVSGTAATRGLTVTAVNDAPSITGGNLAAVPEDTINPPGATVAALFGAGFSDPDAGASLAGVVITSNTAPAAEGVWQYSTDGGSNWLAVGSVGVNGLALDAASLLRFVPAADYAGTPTSLSVRGLDDSHAGGYTSGATRVLVDTSSPGGSSAISASLVSLTTVITPVNDAPVSGGSGATAAEDSSSVFIWLSGSDVDGTVTSFRIDTLPSHGTLYADAALTQVVTAGSEWATTVFNPGNQLRSMYFVPDAHWNGVTGFSYSARDDGGLYDATPGSATLTITPVNDAPTGQPVISGTPTEDQVLTADTSGIADADGLGTFSLQWLRDGVAIAGATGTSYTLGDADVGALITVRADYVDGQGTAESVTSAAAGPVANVNDAPVLDNTQPFVLDTITEDEVANAGNTVAEILASTGSDRVSDADGPASAEGLAIRSVDSGNGRWQYSLDGGGTWQDVGTVSNNQALLLRDIDRVRFVPDAQNGTTASFTFRAWDQTAGTAGTRVSTASGFNGGSTAISNAIGTAGITVSAVDDAPVAVADAAIAVEAGGANNTTPGVDPTGQVLDNDSDVDTGDTRSVTGVAAGVVSTASGAVGVVVAGAYGTIVVAADGHYTYSVDNANAAVQALRTAGDTLQDVFSYTIQDASGLSATTQLTITLRGANDTPTLDNAITAPDATDDQAYSFQLPAGSFGDVDAGDGLSYTASGLPAWLSFDAVTRSFSGTPADADLGAVTITVRATDAAGAWVEGSFVLTVLNANDVPTGMPVIVGTATEDQTLAVDTSGIGDEDGLGSFGFQWLRGGVAIAGATDASYTLGDADVGESITVRLDYVDGQGAAESLTSAPVGPVANVNDAPTGVPVITGTPTEDQTLSLDVTGIADADGPGAFSIQWLRGGDAIAGATSASYTLGDADVGQLIRVRVDYTDQNGTAESLTSAAVGAVTNVNDAPTGLPLIIGTPTEDQTLTLDTTGIADADGLGAFSIQWLRDGVAIVGATGTSLTLGDADVDTLIAVRVDYVDGWGTAESLTSTAAGPVANVNDTPTGLPLIVGTPTEDQTLMADTGGPADADGLGALAYQWLRGRRGHRRRHRCELHAGRRRRRRMITRAVDYVDGQGTAESLTSAAVGPVAQRQRHAHRAAVITGTPTEDQTLTADTTGIADADGLGSFSIQWLRNGVVIAGATGASYTLGDADVGASITVRVDYVDGQGTAETLTSAAAGPVVNVNDAPTGLPAITGTPIEDQTLSVDTAAIADADGLGAFSIQWLRNGSVIAGATGTSYAWAMPTSAR
jgi:uncharacterized delta-60 repeat protein